MNFTTTTLSIAFMALIFAAGAVAQTVTWTGNDPGNNNWSDPDNWAGGVVPGSGADVVIPPDKGVIDVDLATVNIRSLTIQDSTGAGTTLKGQTVGLTLAVTLHPPATASPTDGKVSIGLKNKIITADATTMKLGPLVINATCQVVNKGIICGGQGVDGTNGPTSGASIFIRTPTLCNNDGTTKGTIKGGPAGHYDGNGDGCGQNGIEGGSVNIFATTLKKGTIKGGEPGAGFFGPAKEKHRGKKKWDGGQITVAPGDLSEGSSLLLRCNGPMTLTGLPAGTFVATSGAIRIDALGNDIDLTGIPAGTDVFQADHVAFDGNLILDPGVSIDDLCSGDVHLGRCADAPVEFVLHPENFETPGVFTAPVGWNPQVIVGPNWIFDAPPHLNLGPDWCSVALIDADLNGPNPVQAILETPTFTASGAGGPILLEWDQWHQPSANSTVEVFVVDSNQNPTPVFFDNQGTPQGDHPVIDITSIVNGTDDYFIRFQYNAFDQSFWVIDDVEVRVTALDLGGQAPVPGIATFDVNGARNIDGYTVSDAQPGPYFADVSPDESATFYFEGQANQPIWLLSGFVMPDVIDLPPFGSLDLDDVVLLASGAEPGLLNSLFATGSGGVQTLTFNIPTSLSGLTLGFQAILGSPTVISFSNAVELAIDG